MGCLLGMPDSTRETTEVADRRNRLHADCERCAGLCCVAPAFGASADFAITKRPGQPCPNLGNGFRCTIHERLRENGFPGCVAFDCFGAGQHVVQTTYGGRDWKRHPEIADQMFTVFFAVRYLHELLWYLSEALTFDEGAAMRPDIARAIADIDALLALDPSDLEGFDVFAHGERIDRVLVDVSEVVRAAGGGAGPFFAGADLVGRRMAGHDLQRANFRHARLIGADLNGADLRRADLMGADLRAADVRGADLSTAIFVTSPQLASARGDHATKLPPAVDRPVHWATA